MKYLKYLFFIIYCFTESDFTLDIDTDKNFIMPRNIYVYYNETRYKIVIDFNTSNDKIKVKISSGNYDIGLNDDNYYYFFADYDGKNSDITTACQNYIEAIFSVKSSDQNNRNLLLVYDDTWLKNIKENRIAFLFKCKKSSYKKYMKNQVLNLENQGSNLEEDDDFLYKKARTDSSERSYIQSLFWDDNQPVKNMIAQLKTLMINIGRFFVGSDLLKDLIAIGLLVFIMHYIIKALFEDRINTISMYVIGSNLAFALLINQTFIYFSKESILDKLYILVESLYYDILTFLLGISMEGEKVDLYVALGLHDLSNTLFDTEARAALIGVVIVLIALFIGAFLWILYRYKYEGGYLPTSKNHVAIGSDMANDALGCYFILCLTVGASVLAIDYLNVALTGKDVFTGLNKIFILFTVNISFVFLYIQVYTNIVGIFLAVSLLPLSLSSYFFHIFQDLIQKNIKIIIYMLLYTPICFIIFSIFIDFLETKVEDDDVGMSIITCIVYIMILFYFFYSSKELINSFLISTSSGLQSSVASAFSKGMSSVLSDSSDKIKFYVENQSTQNAYQRYLDYQRKMKSLLEERYDLNDEQKAKLERMSSLSYSEYLAGQHEKKGLLQTSFEYVYKSFKKQYNKNNSSSEKDNVGKRENGKKYDYNINNNNAETNNQNSDYNNENKKKKSNSYQDKNESVNNKSENNNNNINRDE